MKDPGTSPEYAAFKGLLNRLMAVPHSEIVKREAAYQKQSLLNPKRRDILALASAFLPPPAQAAIGMGYIFTR